MSTENKEIIESEEAAYNHADTVVEESVSFKKFTDRMSITIIQPENKEVMLEISGYDLHCTFNSKHLKTTKDIDDACAGLSQVFRELIMEQLLETSQQIKE